MLSQAIAKSQYTFDASSRVMVTEVGGCTSGRRAEASLGSMAESLTPNCMVAPMSVGRCDSVARSCFSLRFLMSADSYRSIRLQYEALY
jgi:hypothetical protein